MVNFNDTKWGTIGKIPPESDFFSGDLDLSDIMDGAGLTMGYSKLVGEQVFKVTEPSETPFTANHTGAPIRAGAGWIERLTKRLKEGTTTAGSAKAGVMQRKLPQNVTAEDDLRYYDSEGKEFVYSSENLKGWIPVSLPSNLDIYDMFNDAGQMGQLNGMLVDNVKQAYDMALESEIQKKAVNLAPVQETVTDTGKDLFIYLRDTVAKMKSDDYAFNMMSEQDNIDYEHRAKDVIIYVNELTYNAMLDDFANLPSPEYIKQIGATFQIMSNKMVTPYSTPTAMYDDGYTDYGGLTTETVGEKVVLDSDKYPMFGKTSPDFLIMDKRWIEYRPVIDSYRVNISKNGAGDFTNEHMHFVGGINIKPWANCKAVHLSSE